MESRVAGTEGASVASRKLACDAVLQLMTCVVEVATGYLRGKQGGLGC